MAVKKEAPKKTPETKVEPAKPGKKSPAAPKGKESKLPGGTVRVDY